MRTTDVIRGDGTGAFQLLLVDTNADNAAQAVARLVQALRREGTEVRIGVARYPDDGVVAEQLIAHAHVQLARDPDAPPSEMDHVRELVRQVATGDLSVLVTGETGTGKELCAEMIHRLSPRAGMPFVRFNCSALVETLVESELFGHEKGAFTGATSAHAGLLEAANGGTVCLDEIGELSLAVQAKLLRVLEERVVRRVGSTAGRTLDIRFVCATNRYLPEEVDAGRFRRDLYYRINGVTISIPPLRERPGELAGLARAFVARPRGNATPTAIADEAPAAPANPSWPGNIRELRNTIERAMLLASNGPIKPEHVKLGSEPPRRSSVPTMPIERITSTDLPLPATPEQPLASAVAEVERTRILDALERCGGNQTRAARMLGISRNTLLARLDSYGLPRPRKS
jgi:transcriptional regulator with GAF, ATPase, and Fis domain